jgi:RNA polymerase sigma-70 factor (ECF subfamily)
MAAGCGGISSFAAWWWKPDHCGGHHASLLGSSKTMADRLHTGRRPEHAPDHRGADAAMNQYAAGDDLAFAKVYDSVAPRLYSYLLRRTRDGAAAEDLLQQTLLQMHRARGSFIAGSLVMPWAFAIARRLFIDRVRRNRRELADEGDQGGVEPTCTETAEHTAEARQLAMLLSVELRRLPESQRVAFELLRMDGLSHTEAAEALGVTVNAVKLRAHRAYLALHAVIDSILSTKSEE